MKSRILKHVIIPVLIIAICFLPLIKINYLLMPKRDDGILPMKSCYAQDDNTIDVLFIGSSHAGVNIDIGGLWENYGYSAFSLWGSMQPFWNTYYFLLEALKTQTPEVVILDVYAATFDFEYSDSARQVANTAGMSFSMNKINAVMKSTEKKNMLNLLVGMPLYNNRLFELNSDDFDYFFNRIDLKYQKGNTLKSGTNGVVVIDDVSKITEVRQMIPKERTYLLKIIELCKSRNLPLVLLKTPTATRKDEQPYYNDVDVIAKENGIDFYNLNFYDKEIGLISTDFWTDDSHMNLTGSQKVTTFIAENILSKYNLTDHRGDEKYISWDKNCELYSYDK